MPYKFLHEKGIEIKKQVYRVSNWSEYNKAMIMRGRIDTYINPNVISKWYENERIYDGTGSTNEYTDFQLVAGFEFFFFLCFIKAAGRLSYSPEEEYILI